MKKIRVLQFGLGNMGSMMAKIMLEKKDLELVGAVVRNEEDKGKDLSQILKLKQKTGVKAYSSLREAIKATKPDIMLHAAVSYVPKVWEQIKPAVEASVNVITIAEEMGYPFKKYPGICKQMDATAKKHNVSILGSGINPGFAMDLLPAIISGICQSVDSIKVTRYIDFSPFGPSIQKNIGIGLSIREFKEGIKSKKLPLHIGLPESTYMLAHALQWKLDKVYETRDPVIAKKSFTVKDYKKVEKGQVAGFNHCSFGLYKGKIKIILEELGRVDPKFEYKNIIQIKGDPDITEWMNVPSGHITTTSHAVNLIPKVVEAQPGLRCMLDLLPAPVLSLK